MCFRIPATHQTAIWYLNNNVYISGASGPTLVAGWLILDGERILIATAIQIMSCSIRNNAPETEIWYLSGRTFIGSCSWAEVLVPSGWGLVGASDFNGDGHPDYMLYNTEDASDSDMVSQ